MPEKAFYYKEFRLGETYTYSEDCLFEYLDPPPMPGRKASCRSSSTFMAAASAAAAATKKHFDGPEWPTKGLRSRDHQLPPWPLWALSVWMRCSRRPATPATMRF